MSRFWLSSQQIQRAVLILILAGAGCQSPPTLPPEDRVADFAAIKSKATAVELATNRIPVDAALGLIRTQGLAGLTMRAVASELGVTPMAVYYYIADKDELVRLVLAHSPKFRAILEKSRRQIEETGGIPHDDFWREIEAESREDAGKGSRGGRRTKRST